MEDDVIDAWYRIQALFVDAPQEATRQADRLVTEVMRGRGYPVEDFEQRAADLSVDHPWLVRDYRAARAKDRSEAGTEDLRRAPVHYRSLFEELLEGGGATPARRGRTDETTVVEEAR